jgi:ceramide glucosyltransferase
LLLRDAILLLALAPFAYYLLALWVSTAYFREAQRRTAGPRRFRPPVSILKPVRGLDRQAYENFASFCALDYPEYEILFCVNAADDPAVPVIAKLQRDFPQRNIRLLIGAPLLGASGKVNKLCRLVHEARYDTLVISDSDVRVTPSYLQEVTAPLEDPRVGAVTVFFRSAISGGTGASLDAVGSAVEFAGSALLARQLEGVHFTLGATMATTKHMLAKIGGFEALVNHYVDDYELGSRIFDLGYRIEFAPTPVCMVYPRQSLRQFLRHELRWTIGLRNVRPTGHAAMGLVLGLPWTLLAILAAPTATLAWLYGLTYLTLRLAMYFVVGVWGLQDEVVRRKWWLIPLRDAATSIVWLASFFANRISWRGLEFRVQHGLLIPLRQGAPGMPVAARTAERHAPPMEAFERPLPRGSTLTDPAVDFTAPRLPANEVVLTKTHEVGR